MTFDGSLPSETLHGEAPRVQIGQQYRFNGPDGAVVGVVRGATVLDATRECYLVIETPTGQHIYREKMTDNAFEDWQENKAAYFGEIHDVSTNPQTPFGMYERFMDMFSDFDRKGLAVQCGKQPDDPTLGKTSPIPGQRMSSGMPGAPRVLTPS